MQCARHFGYHICCVCITSSNFLFLEYLFYPHLFTAGPRVFLITEYELVVEMLVGGVEPTFLLIHSPYIPPVEPPYHYMVQFSILLLHLTCQIMVLASGEHHVSTERMYIVKFNIHHPNTYTELVEIVWACRL